MIDLLPKECPSVEGDGTQTDSLPMSSTQKARAETAAWQGRILVGVKRMTEDESYRLEIAKRLS
jgi:hypothetical protein